MRKIYFEINPNFYDEKYGAPVFQFTLSCSSKQQDGLAHVISRVVESKHPSRICIQNCFPEDKMDDNKFIDAYVVGMLSLCSDIVCLLDIESNPQLAASIIVELPTKVAQDMLVKLQDSDIAGSVLIAEIVPLSKGINMDCFRNRMDEMSTFVEEHIFAIDLPYNEAEEFLDVMENYPYDVYFNDLKLL